MLSCRGLKARSMTQILVFLRSWVWSKVEYKFKTVSFSPPHSQATSAWWAFLLYLDSYGRSDYNTLNFLLFPKYQTIYSLVYMIWILPEQALTKYIGVFLKKKKYRLKVHLIGVLVVTWRQWIQMAFMRMRVWSLASRSGLRIWRGREVWCRLQVWMGSGVAVAMV